ncbi:MAG: MgtC/SapB family protein [Nitrospirota bacterium]
MIPQNEIVIRLLLGTLLGGIIGFERQVHGRPAGFRTQLLVCVACVLLMIVSEYYHSRGAVDPGYVRADPGRIAAGAITGVGFLGAGVILKTGFTIQGLTTAACIWVVAAIGLAIGSGLYFASFVTFIITLVALLLLRIVERQMPKQRFKFLTIGAEDGASEEKITAVIKKFDSTIQNIDYERCKGSGETTFHVTIAFYKTGSLKAILDELSSLDFVKRICIRSE